MRAHQGPSCQRSSMAHPFKLVAPELVVLRHLRPAIRTGRIPYPRIPRSRAAPRPASGRPARGARAWTTSRRSGSTASAARPRDWDAAAVVLAAVEVGTKCIATCAPSMGTSRRTVKHRARADLLRGCRDTVCDGRQLPWLQLALTARRDGVAICLVLFGLLLRLLLGGSLGLLQPPEGPAAAPRPPRCFADSAV